MPKNYGVVEVIYLPTKEKRLIKWDRFNPEIHKQIGDIHSKEHAIHYNQPVHLQMDLVGKAVLEGQLKIQEKTNEEEIVKIATPLEVDNIEVPTEKVDNVFDASVDLPIEEVEKLKMWQLRKYASSRGIEVQPKSTKIELVAQVRTLTNQ